MSAQNANNPIFTEQQAVLMRIAQALSAGTITTPEAVAAANGLAQYWAELEQE